MTAMFGEPIARLEDDRLLRGNGAYLDDLGHDALAAAFVRSPHAHARVLGIDVSGALDVDGLVAIYTYEDLPGRIAEPLPLLIPHPALTHGRTGYPLASDEVNYVGEPVVMVIASDRYLAEDAAERIMVDYEPLPAVVGVDAAAWPPSTWSIPTCRATSPGTWCRATATPPPRSRRRPARSSSTCTSSGRPRRRWKAAGCWRAGTPSPGGCGSGPRPRPRPASGQPSPPSSAWPWPTWT